MRKLFLLCAVALLAFSCKEDTPPFNPVDLAFVDMSQFEALTGTPARGEFTVKAPKDITWSVTSSVEWLTMTDNTDIVGWGGEAQEVDFVVTQNTTAEPRTATLTLSATINGEVESVTTTVTQAVPALTLGEVAQSVAYDATSATFTVNSEANHKGITYTITKGDGATSISPEGLQMINVATAYSKEITVDFNLNSSSTEERTIIATVTYGVDKTLTHTITQAVAPPPPPPIAGGVWVAETNVHWATGNLVANGANGCKIGAPTDYGLYFQWGELVGWSGGATGDGAGVGTPTLTQRVTPTGYTGSTSWDNNADNTGDYATDTPATGEGDPCRYYLGGKWRTPTQKEYSDLFDEGGRLPLTNWSWSETPASVRYTDDKLVFPASGHRLSSNGSFIHVGTGGDYWNSSFGASDYGYPVYFHSDGAYVRGSAARSYGFSVRCVSSR